MKRLLAAAFAALFASLSLIPAVALAVDLTITAPSVVKGSAAKTQTGIAGVTITAGQVVYLDSATAKYGLADDDSATAGVRVPVGIALHGASNNQPLTIVTEGPVTIGATVAVGTAYYASSTAGGIAVVGDKAAGDYPTFIGFATTTGIINVRIVRADVAIP